MDRISEVVLGSFPQLGHLPLTAALETGTVRPLWRRARTCHVGLEPQRLPVRPQYSTGLRITTGVSGPSQQDPVLAEAMGMC